MEAKRILKNIDVQFLSLVTAGANGKSIIYKSANQAAPNLNKEFKIIKTDDEKHLVYATVYEPDTVDSQGDTANASEIEKACHKFSENLRLLKVDTQHNFEANGSTVVENFILRSADPMFPQTKSGSWVTVIKVAAEEIWALIKSGEIGGLSLAGLSGIESVEKGDGAMSEFLKVLKAGFDKLNPLKKDFNEELAAVEIRTKTYALTDAIYNILNDETITDKKTAIIASLDQFKANVETELVAKAGKKISQKNLDKIKTAQQNLSDVIAAATAETTTDGEKTMKAEEVQTIITEALKTGLKPLTDELAKVTGEITAIKAEVKKATDRVEEVAKASKGSRQVEGEEVPVKKAKTNFLGGLRV
jgi:hypothetical protein